MLHYTFRNTLNKKITFELKKKLIMNGIIATNLEISSRQPKRFVRII